MIGRVSPTTPSKPPRTHQPTTNKTCPSTGREGIEFERYNDSLHFFPLLGIISVVYTLQSFVAVGDQQHASLCTAYHPARGWILFQLTLHTIVKPRGGEGGEREKKEETKRRAYTRESGDNRFASTRRKKRSRSLTTLARSLARSLARELIQKREEEEEEEEKEERRAARATARGKRRTGPDRSQQQTDWSVAALGL